MYWGNEKTLKDIHNFINGFKAGRRGTNLGIDEKTAKFDHFSNFVSKKLLNQATTTHSWASIITSQTPCPNEAFKLFYKLLDEFFEA